MAKPAESNRLEPKEPQENRALRVGVPWHVRKLGCFNILIASSNPDFRVSKHLQATLSQTQLASIGSKASLIMKLSCDKVIPRRLSMEMPSFLRP
jgi:hypothetical protein